MDFSSSKYFFSMFLVCFVTLLAPKVVHAQNDDQSGFISIDCGMPEDSPYTDSTTGLNYTSDAGFVDSGSSKGIDPIYKTSYIPRQFFHLRSFPEGTRNCYRVQPTQGKDNKYLIRASFMYGDYDSKSKPPQFDLYLGVDLWDPVTLTIPDLQVMEIIHILESDFVHVCLVNKGLGAPLISALELRPLPKEMYVPRSGSLALFGRWDFGSTLQEKVRYKDDKYDRIWKPVHLSNCRIVRTSSSLDHQFDKFHPPVVVMRTADTPMQDSDPLYFEFSADNSSHQFYFYFHFADFSPTGRAFGIQINGLNWKDYYRLLPLTIDYVVDIKAPWSNYNKYNVSMSKAENSTLPPIINALEVYTVRQFLTSETEEKDVDALLRIRSIYVIKRNWQGDPCSPQAFVWDGVQCSYIDHDSPRIISLNLSTSGLSGIIAPCISNLSDIQSLDLSHNKLTGEVPQFLSALTSLTILNLQENNFSGSVPAPLLEKSKQGLLSLRIDSLENLCQSGACNREKKKKKDKVTILVIASVLTASFVLLAAFITRRMIKRRKQEEFNKLDAESNKNQGLLDKKDRHFTYSEILSITNNFQRVVGKGGFSTVYLGCLGDTQVAVKMLSPSSFQGYNQFHAEANLLVNVHHRNLTPLVGYCIDGNNMGIIYEYMVNGNLEWHISDRNTNVLSWERRLRIARDSAQGLEYLHHGCKPSIIHRDVKCSNILLNEEFQAKLGDFGLSRVFPAESGDHISTIAVGTPGYLDPEYYASNRLTEKSDVYSFGIVLLRIITSRPAIAKNDDKTHIAHWINSRLQEGDIKNIVDPRFGGDFNVNSVWKAVELAIACVSKSPSRRPTMDYVVMELKGCLSMEIPHYEMTSNDSIGTGPLISKSGSGPLVR